MNPLGAFIEERMRDRGWTLAAVCRPPDGERDGGPARSTLHGYMQSGRWLKTMLRPATIAELAVGLETEPGYIRQLAEASTESRRGAPRNVLPPPPEGVVSTRAAIAGDTHLSREARQILLAAYDAAAKGVQTVVSGQLPQSGGSIPASGRGRSARKGRSAVDRTRGGNTGDRDRAGSVGASDE